MLAFGAGAGQAALGRGSWLRLDIQEQGCAHSNGSIQVVTVPVRHVGSIAGAFTLSAESQLHELVDSRPAAVVAQSMKGCFAM